MHVVWLGKIEGWEGNWEVTTYRLRKENPVGERFFGELVKDRVQLLWAPIVHSITSYFWVFYLVNIAQKYLKITP